MKGTHRDALQEGTTVLDRDCMYGILRPLYGFQRARRSHNVAGKHILLQRSSRLRPVTLA